MRTGRLAISRGHQLVHGSEEAVPSLALVPAPHQHEPALSLIPAADPAPAPSAPPTEAPADHELIDRRLTALERLTRLAEQGALSAEEFAEEKALVLGRFAARPAPQGPVSFVPAAPRPERQPRPRGPSLFGRLFGGWRVIPVGLVAGLALSFATQPQATIGVFDEALRLFGI